MNKQSKIKNNRSNITGVLVAIFLTIIEYCLFNYLLLIPISIRFMSMLIIPIILFTINILVINVFINKLEVDRILLAMIAGGTIIVLFLIWFISTSKLFYYKEYRSLAGNIETKKFSKQVSPIDLKQIPVVDAAYAKNLADKKLGTITALGSQVKLGDVTIQQVKGKLCYVIPLEHSGFFKWLSNKEGTPGYIIVSATNADDVKLVTKLNGKSIKIKYQPDAYFSSDLSRHAYFNDMTKGLTDYSFEINDQGRPYWVVTEYKKTIGFSGDKITGVLIIDAQTGKINKYDVDNIPSWVDRVMPVDIVSTNINNWGQLIHGVFNFSNKGELETSSEIKTVYYDSECYYYTGITSVGADESTVGFILTNTRTNKTNFFKVAGSTEKASISSAEGKVQQYNFKGTYPILINVQNQPTYFLTLKDKKGLVKMYAMVNVESYNTVGIGETLEDTMSSYIEGLSTKDNGTSLDTSGILKEGQGTIDRIGTLQTDKDTVFYIILKENPNTLIIAPKNISKELPLTKEGDKITYKYVEVKTKDITIKEFDNLNLNI